MVDQYMETNDFDKRMAVFPGCEFRTLGQRADIEELVQEYIDCAQLHSKPRTRQLLWHLLQSEVAPTRRVADTGLDPTSLIVSLSPRFGQWITYGIFLALLLVASYRARGGNYDLSGFMGFMAIMLLYRWWRVRQILANLDWQVLRELRSGHFHPQILAERLWALERRGFRPHSNAYALLSMCQGVSASADGIAQNDAMGAEFRRAVSFQYIGQ
jgi:hypothetical protein